MKITAVIFTLVVWLFGISQGAQNNAPNHTNKIGYDRLEMFSHFLWAVYPDLSAQQGLSTLRIGVSDGGFQFDTFFRFEFHPCRLSAGALSGIPGPSLSGQQSTPVSVSNCGTPQFPAEKPFLNISVGFGPDKSRPFVNGVKASGSFIDGKLQTVRDQFNSRVYADVDLRDKDRYWTRADALEVLEYSHPKYGPEHKKEFLALLPIRGIQETTGCKLRENSIEFVVRLTNTEPPQLMWSLHGDAMATEISPVGHCWALFEPFGGRLTAIGF
jgi:hypothetical protein